MYLILLLTLAQTPEQEVKNLENDSYIVRILAEENLVKLGEKARPELTKALNSDSAEVRLRAEKIINILNLEDIWDASTVTYNGPYDIKLQQAFNATKNTIAINSNIEMLKNKLEFNYQKKPFWEALDDFCLKTKSHYNFDVYEDRLDIHPEYVHRPRSYCGAFVTSLNSATRKFSEEYNYHVKKSDISHDFNLRFNVEWENRITVLAYKTPAIITAEVAGKNYGIGVRDSNWTAIGAYRAGQVETSVPLRPLPSSIEKIDLLHIKWGFLVSANPVTLILDAEKGKIEDKNLEVILKKVEESKDFYIVQLDLLSDCLFNNEIIYKNIENTKISVKMYNDSGECFSHTKSFSLKDGLVRFDGKFIRKENSAAPLKLEVTYHSIISNKDLDFIFKDIAFPNKNW